jgi:hypothetical protein
MIQTTQYFCGMSPSKINLRLGTCKSDGIFRICWDCSAEAILSVYRIKLLRGVWVTQLALHRQGGIEGHFLRRFFVGEEKEILKNYEKP